MARTNKMGIMKTKQQQAKMKKLTWWTKKRNTDGLKRSYTNPNGSEYEWFMRAGKWVCHMTSCREDPDGYRIRRQPSGGEPQFVHVGKASRWRRRWLKRGRKANR